MSRAVREFYEMGKPTIARISSHSPRAADWERVFGGPEVKLLGPATVLAHDPAGRVRAFYQVDLDALSPEQLERVIEHIADRFDVDPEEVREKLQEFGLPIASEDVTVSFDARLVL